MSEVDTGHIDFPPALKGRPVQKEVYAALRQAGEELKRAEIAEVTGVDPDSVSQALRGLRSDDLVEKVGHGLYTLPSDSHTSNVSNQTTPTVENEDNALTSLLESTAVMEIHTDAEVSAGDGRVVYPSEATRKVEVPRGLLSEVIGFRPPQRIGIMWADGDSMEPTIEDEEMVIYKPVDQISAAGVHVIHANGIKVKRVQPHMDGSFTVISDNDTKGYTDEELVPTENGDVHHFTRKSTGRMVKMYPVGKVIFPDRNTDQLQIQQASRLIRGILRDDVDPKALT